MKTVRKLNTNKSGVRQTKCLPRTYVVTGTLMGLTLALVFSSPPPLPRCRRRLCRLIATGVEGHALQELPARKRAHRIAEERQVVDMRAACSV
jgi:hypothetical protein